jgi:hypothetical protein
MIPRVAFSLINRICDTKEPNLQWPACRSAGVWTFIICFLAAVNQALLAEPLRRRNEVLAVELRAKRQKHHDTVPLLVMMFLLPLLVRRGADHYAETVSMAMVAPREICSLASSQKCRISADSNSASNFTPSLSIVVGL